MKFQNQTINKTPLNFQFYPGKWRFLWFPGIAVDRGNNYMVRVENGIMTVRNYPETVQSLKSIYGLVVNMNVKDHGAMV